jgi:hypothetical protein
MRKGECEDYEVDIADIADIFKLNIGKNPLLRWTEK